eukprot:8235975-Pyramimonas_sp.AAC.1
MNKLPSGTYLQVPTTCKRISTNLWRCACNRAGQPADPAEHILDWHGQRAQKTEWRHRTLAIMTARLIDQMDHASAVHLSLHIRVDTRVRTYVQS